MKNVDDIYRLTPLQEGMLFHAINAPDSGVYVEQICCRLRGPLDVDVFLSAWQQVVDRHAALRTAFMWQGIEHPVQVVRQSVTPEWKQEDWRDRDEASQQDELRRFLAEDRVLGFDPESAPLMRFALFRLNETDYQFNWTRHHLLADGWSTQIVWYEVFSFYNASLQGTSFDAPEPRRFRDLVAWLARQDHERAEEYWRQLLDGIDETTRFPMNDSRRSDGECVRRELRLTCDETASLADAARRNRLTLNTLALGAWALALGRYSGRDDVVFGATTSGRPAELTGAAETVGLFINTLPVRARFDPECNLVDWLTELQRQQIESRRYEYTSLADIQQWSSVPNGEQLFETLFVFENHPDPVDAGQQAADGIGIEDYEVFEYSNYPLAFLVVPDEELRLVLIANDARFDADTLDRLNQHLGELLRAMVHQLQQPLRSLPLVSERDRQTLSAWSDSAPKASPNDSSWLALFEHQAAVHPERRAVACGGEVRSYAELNRDANQLAHHLRAAGVGANAVVGICMERSVDLLSSILAVLKSGAAYVPLDPSYPRLRLETTVSEAEIGLVVTHDPTDTLWVDSSVYTININADRELLRAASSDNLTSKPGPDDGAYVIFTSGSTDRPRGVRVTHANLMASTQARFEYYSDDVGSFLLLSSVSFDSSVVGIFWTLAQGGLLVVPTEHEFADPAALTQRAREHRVTHLLCIPRFYHELLQADRDAFSTLTTAIVAGEACAPDVVQRHIASVPHAKLFNEYGPTEATVWCTVHECGDPADGDRVPIGRPVPGYHLLVLDQFQLPVPVGVAGELCVGGPGVTTGYINDDQLTAQKFIPDTIANNGGRMYRTGDLVRYRVDGVLEFIGRADGQVKIRGHRIEPAEIESALAGCPGIREAIVVAWSDDRPQSSRDDSVPDAQADGNGHSADPEHLIRQLAELAPEAADSVLRSVETKNGAASRGSNGHPVNGTLRLQRDRFEVRLTGHDDGFLSTPRRSQRSWLINQAIHELADDLEHLDAITPRFVPGRDHSGYDIADASLSDQEIMEDWQIPLMRAMAAHVTESHGDVLEIGFGRGVSAGFIQDMGVKSHTVVESNGPCVERHFRPWRDRYPDRDIRLIHSRWQDATDQLGVYDGIFFHAFPLNEQELADHVVNSVTYAEHFFETAASHLRHGGVFTYLSTEIDSVSRRHQRSLFRWFRSLSASVLPVTIPPDTHDAWWADSMVVIRAEK